MRDCWSAFRQSRDRAVRRRSLEMLRPLIDRWLAEPGVIRDLEQGRATADTDRRKRWSSLSPPEAEFPFDRGGEAQDAYFYWGSGTISELMGAEVARQDPHCIFGRVAYFVTLCEKRYATPAETRMHFSSDQAFRVHVGCSTAGPKHAPGNYLVLTDPAGSFDGGARVVYASTSLARARLRADELAETYQVRCLVGRVVRSIDTH
jgi:hypothetical protein